MSNSYNCKNYAAHGGNEWVIGGKLTILPGATIEGGDGLIELPESATVMTSVADSEATTIAALRDDFNALLVALRTAGLMENAENEASE